MKKLKNNKGITGIDIVVSITLIIVILGIVITIYSTYTNKSKEVKRTTVATNLAMKVIEYIEKTDINDTNISDITTTGKQITSGYGISGTIPQGYTINAKKIVNQELENIAFQVDVTVTYEVKDENKKITLSTVKKYRGISEAEQPVIERNTEIMDNKIEVEHKIVYGSSEKSVFPVKEFVGEEGYLRTDSKDIEWYSISSKKFPIVVEADEDDFNRNGIIKLENCSKIYVWMPSYGTFEAKYRFCDKEGKIIRYIVDSETKIGNYIIGTQEVTGKVTGIWVEVDSNLESSNSNYNTLKNKIFTWE